MRLLPALLALTLTSLFVVLPASHALDSSQTEHFRILYEPDEVSARAVELAREITERDFERLRAFLGPDRVHSPVVVVLGGHAERPDGSWEIPRVDGSGRALLFRYTDDEESYFTSLPHELVHIFRGGNMVGDWFIEEAFAAYVSDQLAPENPGFPVYGLPVDVVAGQWLVRDEAIPLGELRRRHRELNQPCMAQAYTLRLAFFRYLHDTYGKEAVLGLAYAPRVHGREPFAEAFGTSFEELERAWREDLLQRYDRVEGAEALADSYRTETPVRHWKICRAGDDF